MSKRFPSGPSHQSTGPQHKPHGRRAVALRKQPYARGIRAGGKVLGSGYQGSHVPSRPRGAAVSDGGGGGSSVGLVWKESPLLAVVGCSLAWGEKKGQQKGAFTVSHTRRPSHLHKSPTSSASTSVFLIYNKAPPAMYSACRDHSHTVQPNSVGGGGSHLPLDG